MLIERYADAAVAWAPAKVNLFLEVLAKRPDGYHEIATLMVAVRLYDTLVFKEEPSGDVLLRCDHPHLSTGPRTWCFAPPHCCGGTPAAFAVRTYAW